MTRAGGTPGSWQDIEGRWQAQFVGAEIPGREFRYTCFCGAVGKVAGGPGQSRVLAALAKAHIETSHRELVAEINDLYRAGVHAAFASLYSELVIRDLVRGQR